MPGIITVDELTRYLSLLFEGNELLSSILVRGSLSDFKRHSSGHVYFSIVGSNSRVSCVLFKSDAGRIPEWPCEGDEVLVEGKAGVYGARGTYQIYARNMRPLGEGAQARARKEIFDRLSREGLFDPFAKRKFPRYPSRIAIVTSPTGAAVRDVLKVSNYRFPLCSIFVVPVTVQGVESGKDIVRGIARASDIPGIESVMLVRGGGSREDLNPFDEEEVVRAVRRCKVPLITGLGHQIDRTLSDLAADLDAPTPSAAAEALFPSRLEVRGIIRSLFDRSQRILSARLQKERSCLFNIQKEISGIIQHSAITPAFETLSGLRFGLLNAAKNERMMWISALENAASALDALSPLKVLTRGFASCTKDSGELVTHVSMVNQGDELIVRVKDGSILAGVKGTKEIDLKKGGSF